MAEVGVGHPGEIIPFPNSESNYNTPAVFFKNFFKEHETDLAGCGPIEPHPASTEIFHEDAPANLVYFIERGIVKLSRMDPNGGETDIGLRGRHWFLGMSAVFLGVPYTLTARTLAFFALPDRNVTH